MNILYFKRKVGLIGIVAIFVSLNLISVESASAATNCRQVMRDLQVEVIGVKADINADATTEEIARISKIIENRSIEYPECKSEFLVWWEWNQDANPLTPFPFGKSDDPRVYPLGPISWWWDLIYIDLFGRNILLMFLFGWEIFLGGIWFAGLIPLMLLSAIIPSLGTLLSRPMRVLRRRENKNKDEFPEN
ncbi:MAG: hypothetical protein Q7R42_04775 [Candidatus Planktophila sp.]|nr:hypothetical protein [Candidatus Planktophila sp.]